MRQTTNEQDPFKDPLPNPLRSHPVTPELGSTMHRAPTNASQMTSTTNGTDQVSSWIRDWTNSYAASLRSDNPFARSNSPGKTDERTSSNLSENSNRSDLSSDGRSVARTSSTRSHLFFGLSGHPSITPSQAPSASIMSRSISPEYWQHRPKQSSLLAPARPLYDRAPDSSSTQCTTFGQLIAEGEALLGPQGGSKPLAPLSYRVRPTSTELVANAGPTPPLPPRRRGWMGSIRQVFSGDRSLSASYANRRMVPPIQMPPQQYTDRSASNSPVKGHNRTGSSVSSTAPRRAASDSSEFMRVRRGRRDWEGDENDPRWKPYRDEPDTGDWGDVPEIALHKVDTKQGPADDEREDWDIEEAAANRDVQVMFTVPKARLRVVNADVDKSSVRSISDSANSIRARQMLKEQEKQEKEDEKKEEEEAADAGAQRKPSNYGIQIMDWEREALEKRDREEEEEHARKSSDRS